MRTVTFGQMKVGDIIVQGDGLHIKVSPTELYSESISDEPRFCIVNYKPHWKLDCDDWFENSPKTIYTNLDIQELDKAEVSVLEHKPCVCDLYNQIMPYGCNCGGK